MPNLFATDNFMPHGHCFLWQPDILLTHVISDAVTAIAYFSIPLVIVLFHLRRRGIGFQRISLLFAAFVFGCGLTHVMGIVVLWDPQYQVQGIAKALTAIVSLWTAIELWPLLPRLIALPRPSDLRAANAALRGEIAERERAERALVDTNAGLEEHVRRRTSDLSAALEMLEQSSMERQQFLARFSHELRTPLNAIIGFSDAMLAGVGGAVAAARHREYLGHIKGAGEHLLLMISDILDMSRIESGNADLRLEPLDLAGVIDECVATTGIMARAVDVTIRTDLSAPVPVVEADRRAIKQILLNLLGNAIKYAPGSGEIVLSVSQPDTTSVEIAVSDRGPGIAESDLDRILRPFVQGRGLDPSRFGSTGLGLSICKGLVELHGGRLLIDSSPGAGTRAAIRLPAGR